MHPRGDMAIESVLETVQSENLDRKVTGCHPPRRLLCEGRRRESEFDLETRRCRIHSVAQAVSDRVAGMREGHLTGRLVERIGGGHAATHHLRWAVPRSLRIAGLQERRVSNRPEG